MFVPERTTALLYEPMIFPSCQILITVSPLRICSTTTSEPAVTITLRTTGTVLSPSEPVPTTVSFHRPDVRRSGAEKFPSIVGVTWTGAGLFDEAGVAFGFAVGAGSGVGVGGGMIVASTHGPIGLDRARELTLGPI